MKFKLPRIKKAILNDNIEEEHVPQEEQKTYANLKEVMDYSRVFSIIYSGVENDSYFNILYDMGIRNFLMSYHYLQTKHVNLKERFENGDCRLFIDSGAHTYQNDPKYFNVTVDEWEKHIEKYLRWVEKNRKYIFAIANCDFENLVGGETVDYWNKKYFEPFMLRTGIPVCFVWHQNSAHDWDFYCQRYPYVGFSSVNTEGESIELDEYIDRLKTAEKHDSLVHGFGMTRTSMLTSIPFYTSDSTTWLVGLQYGELNFWDINENKMKRLKKEVWKSQINSISSRYNLDPEKLHNEDIDAVIRANIGAFIDAQNFVCERLKARMYWLKAKANKVDLDNLPNDFYPPKNWFYGSMDNVKEYAEKFNINPECEEVRDIVCEVVAFMNWDNSKYRDLREKYEYNSEFLTKLHEKWVNRIVPDDESRIEDLRKFYAECVCGNNDKLLHLGTNFDRIAKERDSYIEDEETTTIDLSEAEIKERLKDIIPTENDAETEISSLDDEIFKKADIVPVRDASGKFLKGQQTVQKPKKVYSKKFPKFVCDTCYAAQRCPEYKSGYVCAYQKMFEQFDTRDLGDVIQGMQGITNHNMTRLQRAMIMEVINGTIDPNVSNLMNQTMSFLNNMARLYEANSNDVLKYTKITKADGTTEEFATINNPSKGGVLERMFANLTPSKDEEIDEVVINTTEEQQPVNTEIQPDKKKNDRYNTIED